MGKRRHGFNAAARSNQQVIVDDSESTKVLSYPTSYHIEINEKMISWKVFTGLQIEILLYI